MSKVDLHVHSKYSNHPSEWFLQRLGASESYTEIDFIYELAKKRGMDYVTITDHNSITGSLVLKERYPLDTFTGVEATAYFPEDGCKIHILIYDIDERQFQEIQILRKDIYQLRDYIKEQNLLYSVAHATYSVNNTVGKEHIEKLLLLFDVFEGYNGARHERHNLLWVNFLFHLNENHIHKLYTKYRIEPFSEQSWLKGVTGGSDDHAGILLARTYTTAEAATLPDFLSVLRQKGTAPKGRHNDFRSLTFSYYKIAYDFAKSKAKKYKNSPITLLTSLIFDDRKLGLKEKFAVMRLKRKENVIKRLLGELIEEIKGINIDEMEKRSDIVYDKAIQISDELVRVFLSSFSKDVAEGRIDQLIKNISSLLPGIFLYIPFLSTFTHLHSNRELLDELFKSLGQPPEQNRYNKKEKVLWFTDTLTTTDGISVTLREIGWSAHQQNKKLKFLTSLPEDASRQDLPPNVINLASIFSFPLPLYDNYFFYVPSILSALKEVYTFDPDVIYISTPGPIGLLGLVFARLLNIRSIGIYHSDYTAQAKYVMNDITITNLVKNYIKWFYSSLDEIRVSSHVFKRVLEERGFETAKLQLFHRGVDAKLFSPKKNGKKYIKEHFKVRRGLNLLYVGKISKEKNLDLLLDIFTVLSKRYTDLNLIIAGDGPYLEELKNKTAAMKHVYLLGKIKTEQLPYLYSAAHIFLFPSSIDTFGRVVLEAQACKVPAIVSHSGGSREIVSEGETGYVVHTFTLDEWITKIDQLLVLIKRDPVGHRRLQEAARQRVLNHYAIHKVLDKVLESEPVQAAAEQVTANFTTNS